MKSVPMSTYLVAWAVHQFKYEERNSSRGIPVSSIYIGCFCNLSQGSFALQNEKQSITFTKSHILSNFPMVCKKRSYHFLLNCAISQSSLTSRTKVLVKTL